MARAKLEKPLYHGTAKALLPRIIADGFKPPIYLCESKERAIHYAKAACAYVEDEIGVSERYKGCVVFTFKSVPDKNALVVDDYNPQAEPGQWKYVGKLSSDRHYTFEEFKLDADKHERLRLKCFAIGMWQK